MGSAIINTNFITYTYTHTFNIITELITAQNNTNCPHYHVSTNCSRIDILWYQVSLTNSLTNCICRVILSWHNIYVSESLWIYVTYGAYFSLNYYLLIHLMLSAVWSWKAICVSVILFVCCIVGTKNSVVSALIKVGYKSYVCGD